MSEKDGAASPAFCDFGEERVTRFSRCSFDRHLFFLRQHADVRRVELKIDIFGPRGGASISLARLQTWQAERLPHNFSIVICGEFFDEARIGITRSAAQLVIEVADDQSLVTQIDKQMEQRDRIAPAGNADKIALGWRKFGNNFGINVQGAVAPNKRSTAGPERKSNGLTEQAVSLRDSPDSKQLARLDYQSRMRGSTSREIVSRDLEMVAVGIAKINRV